MERDEPNRHSSEPATWVPTYEASLCPSTITVRRFVAFVLVKFLDTGVRIGAPMPNCVLTCETCGGRNPFLIYEGELAEMREGKPFSKYCPVCRVDTNWTFSLLERRSGRERRQGTDRRSSAA